MQTENTYVETDLGNIALNPRGEYSGETSYEYLDTVSYMGGSYVCLAELTKTISGIAPAQGENTDYWQMLTLPGQLTPEAVAMHDDVVNKAKQVETSRAAVELSQQEVEAAQADVSQMRQDTQDASEEAIASRDSAAGYAQSAEASRTAAKESEDNINAQVTGFDTHVTEKTSAAETAVEEVRKTAINAITTQQDVSTKAVTDEGTTQIKMVGGAGNTAVSAVAKQQAASVQAVEDAGTAQVTAIESAGDEQITEVNKAGTVQVENVEKAAKQQNVNITEAAAQELIKLQAVAKQFAEDHEQIETNKEDLSNKITKFYASNQGETHLADSDNGKIMDMMLYGKSSQFTTTGKNLANGQNINCFINSVADTCGISSNDIGMVIDVSKLTNASISTRSIQDRYRFACANTVPTRGNPITCYNGTNKDGTKDSYTMDTTGYNYLFINATKLEDIQVEKGSESTSYEPYTGGIPSPSPDYPQEIKSVVNPTVNFLGANILNIKNTDETVSDKNGLTYSVKNGVIKVKGTATSSISIGIELKTANGYLRLKKNNTYIFNPNSTKEESDNAYLDFTNSYSIGFSFKSNNTNKPVKITERDIERLFSLTVRVKQGAVIDMEWKPQFLLNNTLLPYQPYTEQTITLPYTLNAIPVSSGGNVTINGQQYVADYVDVEKGKIIKCVEKYRIPSGLNWMYEPLENDRFGVYGLNININPNFGGNTLFTHYQNKPSGVGGFIAPGNIRLHNFQGFTDVTNFKEWLDKNESYAYFVKNTLEEIDLTIEEIQIFKALSTYYPVTNISVNSEQLDGYTVFNYPISMANGWNYVKQQLNDNRDYIYDMDTKTQDIDTQAAEAYVNSEYAVALTELEV